MNVLDYATQCKLALQGAVVRWQDTPIEVTPMARATDPFRQTFQGNDWWKRAEPTDGTGRALIRLPNLATLKRTLRDGKEEENRMIHHSNEAPAGEVGDELAPNEKESIGDWFGRLAKHVDFNGPKKNLVDAMRAYASRFRGDGSAKKLLDAKLIRKFLEQIA